MKDNIFKRLYEGMIRSNPVAVLCLGLCPALAVTTTAINGIAMGFITLAVLICTNFIMSIFNKLLSGGWWLFCFLFVSSTFTVIADLLVRAIYPGIHEALGIFIPLTAINTLIFERANNYSARHNFVLSIFDGIGMGFGYTIMLFIIGAIREILGLGTLFGHQIIPVGYNIPIIVMAPGGFFVLAFIIAIANKLGGRKS